MEDVSMVTQTEINVNKTRTSHERETNVFLTNINKQRLSTSLLVGSPFYDKMSGFFFPS